MNEQLLIEYMHNKSKFQSQNLSMTLLLTWACNLKCVYCYEGAGEKRNTTMNADTATNVVSFIKNESMKRNVKSISILLFGGEPLLNYETGEKILDEIDQFCKEKNMLLTTRIITNGTLLNDRILESLVKYNCKYMQITIDGNKEMHNQRRMYKDDKGTYDDIISILQKIEDKYEAIYPLIRINIDKTNLHQTLVFLDEFNKLGFKRCKIDFGVVRSGTNACSSYEDNCFVEEKEVADVLNVLWRRATELKLRSHIRPLKKFIYCGLNADNSFSIAPTGDVYKCWEQVGMEEHKYGRLNEQGRIADIKDTFFKWMLRNPMKQKGCKDCIYLPCCGGGCAAKAYKEFGTYDAMGCFMTRGTIENMLKLYLEEKYGNDLSFENTNN